MPKSQAERYSPRVPAPSAITAIEIIAVKRRIGRATFSPDKRPSAPPQNNIPNAVLAFIVTRPGKTLCSAAISNSQPRSTAIPVTDTQPPAVRANIFGFCEGIDVERDLLFLASPG